MSWVRIDRLEPSQWHNSESKLAYFKFQGRERYSIVSKAVLDWLKIVEINVGDKLFVVKSFNNKGFPIFIVKQHKRKGE